MNHMISDIKLVNQSELLVCITNVKDKFKL